MSPLLSKIFSTVFALKEVVIGFVLVPGVIS
jgi:hypothetical protein